MLCWIGIRKNRRSLATIIMNDVIFLTFIFVKRSFQIVIMNTSSPRCLYSISNTPDQLLVYMGSRSDPAVLFCYRITSLGRMEQKLGRKAGTEMGRVRPCFLFWTGDILPKKNVLFVQVYFYRGQSDMALSWNLYTQFLFTIASWVCANFLTANSAYTSPLPETWLV